MPSNPVLTEEEETKWNDIIHNTPVLSDQQELELQTCWEKLHWVTGLKEVLTKYKVTWDRLCTRKAQFSALIVKSRIPFGGGAIEFGKETGDTKEAGDTRQRAKRGLDSGEEFVSMKKFKALQQTLDQILLRLDQRPAASEPVVGEEKTTSEQEPLGNSPSSFSNPIVPVPVKNSSPIETVFASALYVDLRSLRDLVVVEEQAFMDVGQGFDYQWFVENEFLRRRLPG